MKRVPLLFAGLFLVACGGSQGESIADGTPDPGTDTTGTEAPPGSSGGTEPSPPPGGILADLRADANRDGEVRLDDPADDVGEDTWDEKHGAVFLANIDDDEEQCPTGADDVDLPSCNDAADDVLNGPEDALDLARLKTAPWAAAPEGATATLTTSAAEHVRLFKVKGSTFTALKDGATLDTAEVRSGVELAIEARDIVRDPKVWDGYVDVTLTVSAGGGSATDKVRMRVSPLLTYHHLSPTETTFVSILSSAGNAAMRADLATAATAAGVPAPRTISTNDQWTQDFFETGYMSMPAKGGAQHVIRVNIRSANVQNPQSFRNPLRRAGRVVFTQLRGKDSAGVQQYDKGRPGTFDTLNSFGNFETIPPYTHGGESYPLGRVFRGLRDPLGISRRS